MRLGSTFAVTAAVLTAPSWARAQYRNNSFGLDAGYWLVTKPSVIDPATGGVYTGDQLPLRLQNGVRIGGEANRKMEDDHVWLTGRVDVGFLHFPTGSVLPSASLQDQFDYEARRTLGTVIGIEGQLGVRYVFLTDRFRPYLQLALSYLRLMTFSSQAETACSAAVCGDETNEQAFLRHPNLGAVHVQPGVELILQRDFALHFFLDVQRWLVLNAKDNNSVVIGVGVLFFT